MKKYNITYWIEPMCLDTNPETVIGDFDSPLEAVQFLTNKLRVVEGRAIGSFVINHINAEDSLIEFSLKDFNNAAIASGEISPVISGGAAAPQDT